MVSSVVMSDLSAQNVYEYLKSVVDEFHGDDTLREYEESIVKLIDLNKWSVESVTSVMQQLIKSDDRNVAYAAFCALCTFYRRNHDINEYGDIINKFRSEFQHMRSFAFLELMYQEMKSPDSPKLLDTADQLCAPDMLGSNYGVQHCYAEYVAIACEKDIDKAEYVVKKHMEKALSRVNDALRLSNGYPKFYVTRARLLVIKAIFTDGKEREILFNSALEDIDLAVATEKVVSKMVGYQITGTRLQMLYYQQSLSKNIAQQEASLNERIQDVNVKNLEFLGFFSAIIGLMLANIQLVQNLHFAQAATLVVVLNGCILTAFGALGFILHGTKERLKTNCIIIALGLILTIVALIYGGIYAI